MQLAEVTGNKHQHSPPIWRRFTEPDDRKCNASVAQHAARIWRSIPLPTVTSAAFLCVLEAISFSELASLNAALLLFWQGTRFPRSKQRELLSKSCALLDCRCVCVETGIKQLQWNLRLYFFFFFFPRQHVVTSQILVPVRFWVRAATVQIKDACATSNCGVLPF